MPHVMVPGGEYRLHSSPVDLAQSRVANRFGIAGLAGVEDPRSIPARGPSVVLPLVRGKDGWFYLGEGGHRAQDRRPGMRGMRGFGGLGLGGLGLGDVSVATLQAFQAQFPAGTVDWKILQDLIDNPAFAQTEIGQAQLAGVIQTAQQGAQGQQNPTVFYTDPSTGYQAVGLKSQLPAGATNVQVAGANLPGTITWNPDLIARTAQEAASAATQKPNQTVAPTTPLTTLPTGTGASGGNPILGAGTEVGGIYSTPSHSSGLVLLLLGAGVLYMMGRK